MLLGSIRGGPRGCRKRHAGLQGALKAWFRVRQAGKVVTAGEALFRGRGWRYRRLVRREPEVPHGVLEGADGVRVLGGAVRVRPLAEAVVLRGIQHLWEISVISVFRFSICFSVS